MLIVRRYKKKRSGSSYFWEYKISYKDIFTNKYKTRRRGGFHTRDEALSAATEMMEYLRLPMTDIISRG